MLVRIVVPVIMAALFVWSLLDDWSKPDYLFAADGGVQIGTLSGLILMAPPSSPSSSA